MSEILEMDDESCVPTVKDFYHPATMPSSNMQNYLQTSIDKKK